MSRDFSPDLESFRVASRQPRQKRNEAPPGDPGRVPGRPAERTQLRLPEVNGIRAREVPTKESRVILYDRYRGYDLRESEVRALVDLGRFRVIAADDLARFAYNNDKTRMEQETANLTRRGLIEEREVDTSFGRTSRIFALTRAGRKLLVNSNRLPKGQEIYSGFVKPKEAKHDAELYRVYQREAARIEERGGRVRRVVLDYELKKKVNGDLMQIGDEKENLGGKEEVAERYGLRVVAGRIPLPDLQIEYEMPERGVVRVNLELATGDYRPAQIAEKARAGFTIYSHPDDGARARRILDQQELTAEILSL
jgi:DNA-binding PadR family transcriptional regulator